jgi:hypothetical protein
VTHRIKHVKSAIRLHQRDDSILSLVSAQSLCELVERDAAAHGGSSGRDATGAVPPSPQQPPPPPQQQQQQQQQEDPDGYQIGLYSPWGSQLSSPVRQRRLPLSERLVSDAPTFEDEPTLLRLMTARLVSTEGDRHQGTATGNMAAETSLIAPPILPRCVPSPCRCV